MSKQQSLKHQLTEAVVKFQKEQMSISADRVWADLHPDSLVVTILGATCPAEQDYAKDAKARELLERLYNNLFATSKRILEVAIEEILGRTIEHAKLSVDPESGDHVILFTLAGESCRQSDRDNSGGRKASEQ